MLLLSPRNDRQRRASLLLPGVLLCVIFANVCASFPAGGTCHLDCAREHRHSCKPGSSHCGPCLFPLEENKERHCVVRKRRHPHGPKQTTHTGTLPVHHTRDAKVYAGEKVFHPDLDEEIDFLIEKQVSENKPPKPSKQHVTQSSQTDVIPKQKQRGNPPPVDLPITANPPASTHPNTPTAQPRATGVENRLGPIPVPVPRNDSIIVIVISLCITVGIVAVVLAAVCFIRFNKESRLAQKVDYPAFWGGGQPPTTTNGTSMGDTTLAQNAQMYHYQHQKQQMCSMGKHQPEQKVHDSEVTSDEEEVGGDFTVYECPGLAPTGEMEVKNPLFDDSTLHHQGNHK